MDQFEYIVSEYNLTGSNDELPRYQNDLRAAGLDGWELVNVVPLQRSNMQSGVTTKILATFKRKIPTQSQQQPQRRVS